MLPANSFELDSMPIDELNERDIEVTLTQILDEGSEFTHEYDFGITTELDLRVVET
jgi:hypothetical protein